jgi:hypothetical protein
LLQWFGAYYGVGGNSGRLRWFANHVVRVRRKR